jgi:hypothetical protein
VGSMAWRPCGIYENPAENVPAGFRPRAPTRGELPRGMISCVTRLVLPLFIGLAVISASCGGGGTKTVTVAGTSTPSTTTPAKEPSESPSEFTQRILRYFVRGQYGREWDYLHPGHQRLITREQYVACGAEDAPSDLTGEETVKVLEVYDDPIHVRGIPQRTSKAVSVQLRQPFEGGSEPVPGGAFTSHAVQVGDQWRWILSHEFLAAIRRGECQGGSPIPKD